MYDKMCLMTVQKREDHITQCQIFVYYWEKKLPVLLTMYVAV